MKPKYTLLFTILYSIIAIAEINAELLSRVLHHNLLIWITKPLLMPVLIAWVLVEGIDKRNRFRSIILVSLIFSMAGDVFLMFRNESFFIFGLGSFLVAHVLYIAGFWGNLRRMTSRKPWGAWILLSIPYLAFIFLFLNFLSTHILGNPITAPLFVPVAVYASVLGMVGIFATVRYPATNAQSFNNILAGALLFISSDSLIALSRFTPVFIPYASVMIMVTYIIAQYLIVKGTLWHSSPRS